MSRAPLVSIAWSKLLLIKVVQESTFKTTPSPPGLWKKGSMNKPVLSGQWSQKPKDWGRALSFTLLLRAPLQKEELPEGCGGRLTLQFTQQVWLCWLIWGQRFSMVGLQKGPDLKMNVREINGDTTPCPTSEGLTGDHEVLRMVHPRD